ncbi:G-type lectin S-receptor-like serine/threonine-protein kinase LECRK1 [Salvia miltiorrhiza]|uniref:G-type lectin S-receptor-like serine/threonine-protein kinase LECRK1 n=1 Tax=Salvia miltiorrhiza TaxID=226208 RepID=UPI0025ACDE01|nr:G-type lectin S-receptor-like serine/threonine-protein kinase LECRK1 [Salvia miltiorrhiza]
MAFVASSPSRSLPLTNMLIITVVLLLLPIPATAQSRTNITLGSSLVANAATSTWLSPSAEFAFGFQPTAGGDYLLAIWFHKIPEKTIIWSANRDNPAPQGSTLRLAANGRLQLNDPSGRQFWAANPAAAYAALLDSGNLVLFSAASENLWQSFDEPTDTLVPSQILNRDGQLISSFSDRNHSRGRFFFIMQTDGNLVWYTRNFPMGDPIKAYLATQTVGDGFRFIFNTSGYVNLVSRNGTLLSNIYSNIGAPTTQFYQRVTLDYDGVLRHYLYPKSNSSGGRATAWSVYDFLPSNICTAVTQDTGGGVCGFNSLCSVGTNQRPRCTCPWGYSAIDPNYWATACKRDFIPQSCNHDEDLFGFNDMPNVNWPLSDYEHFTRVLEDWCRQDCLSDCFCDVAIYGNTDCWKKRVPLSNGKINSSVQGKALIKVRMRNSTVVSPSSGKSGKRNRVAFIIAGAVLLGTSVFLNLLVLVSKLFFDSRRKSNKDGEGEGNKRVYPGVNIRCFGFKELEEATNGFSEQLGNGTYSTVYKGALIDEDGKMVAVKKLSRMVDDAEKEFRAEVSSISKTNHKNLVQLLGYCDEGQNRLLVYEFMSNGSLATFLFENSPKPKWYTRVQIAVAVARGLCYLHEECSTQIIHCDIHVFVPPHPLIKHWISVLRNEQTPCPIFKNAMAELGRLLIYEASREWLNYCSVCKCTYNLDDHGDRCIRCGGSSDDNTWLPEKFPEGSRVFVVDPMLATGITFIIFTSGGFLSGILGHLQALLAALAIMSDLMFDFLGRCSNEALKEEMEEKRRAQITFMRKKDFRKEQLVLEDLVLEYIPHNVLLDDAHTAKISDFGLAKLMRADQTRTTTGIRGTRGYVAPEWFGNIPITVKVDVYSYGIMLLELVCCRKNFDPDVEDQRRQILSDWAYDCCCDGAVEEMLVEEEMRDDDIKRFEKMVRIAMWCVQEDPELRPQMKRVVHMLEGSAEVPSPPDPASFVC